MTAVAQIKPPKAPKPPKPPIFLKPYRGTFIPADHFSQEDIARRGYREGDVLKGIITKLRSGKFNRLAHQIGALCAIHIEDFRYADGHEALKRLQIEGNIACDAVRVKLPELGWITYLVPRSISYESMDESEFRGVVAKLCSYISETYWPSLSAAQIETMAHLMVAQV